MWDQHVNERLRQTSAIALAQRVVENKVYSIVAVYSYFIDQININSVRLKCVWIVTGRVSIASRFPGKPGLKLNQSTLNLIELGNKFNIE